MIRIFRDEREVRLNCLGIGGVYSERRREVDDISQEETLKSLKEMCCRVSLKGKEISPSHYYYCYYVRSPYRQVGFT